MKKSKKTKALTTKQKAIGRLLSALEMEGSNDLLVEFGCDELVTDVKNKALTKVVKEYVFASKKLEKELRKLEKEVKIWEYDWFDFEEENEG